MLWPYEMPKEQSVTKNSGLSRTIGRHLFLSASSENCLQPELFAKSLVEKSGRGKFPQAAEKFGLTAEMPAIANISAVSPPWERTHLACLFWSTSARKMNELHLGYFVETAR